jgi:hypothetical protein
MSAIKGHFEAKKHAYRQTQDGVVISFVVHPNDVSPALAAAALGTVFMLGYAEVVEGEEQRAETPDKPHRKWDDLSPSQQAGIACNDPRFIGCVAGQDPSREGAAAYVREFCGVESRAELDTKPTAAERWRDLYARFRQEAGLETEMRA